MSKCNHTNSTLTGHELCIYNEGVRNGEEVAEERIIKLLEPLTICADDCDHYDCGTWALKQGIDLIKGEK